MGYHEHHQQPAVSRDVVGVCWHATTAVVFFVCVGGPHDTYAHLFFQGIGVFGAEYLAGLLMGLDPLQTVIPWTLGEDSLWELRWSLWCIFVLLRGGAELILHKPALVVQS